MLFVLIKLSSSSIPVGDLCYVVCCCCESCPGPVLVILDRCAWFLVSFDVVSLKSVMNVLWLLFVFYLCYASFVVVRHLLIVFFVTRVSCWVVPLVL